jgi:5-methylcytosine-specific restriction endonuclease McrA
MVKVRKLDLTLDELANNDEIQGKLKKLKGLLAHSDPNISMMDLINKLCDLGIKHWDPGQQKPKVRKPSAAARKVGKVLTKSVVETPKVASPIGANKSAVAAPRPNSRYIPLATQREVWRRANSCCENCGGNYAPQIEHIIPIAVGGSNEPDNLKLLCRNCNLRNAITYYGRSKIERLIRLN